MIIEAVLFAAGYPVTYTKLGKVLNMAEARVKTIVKNMVEEYGEESQRGIILLALPDSAQLCTKECYSSQIKEALGIKRGGNLSASSLEVLATVAYNQPVTRAYIDTVRGVDSAYAINSLSEKGLIEACGRLDAPGRPVLYRTTDDFLRCFGLSSLDELPEVMTEITTVDESSTNTEN
ncbi:MAG: SMC-Scp complex subunit ScpB [Clostridia bacterium]|nr:SMC-Scp complex subunit ScpB [Clostridia bacterium]